MRNYEASAKTVEEAIELGLQELGVSIGDVDVQVLEEGSKGLFGLFGSRLAKVRLTVKEEEADPLEDLIGEEKPAAKAPAKEKAPAPRAEKPAREPKPEKKPEAKPENKPEPKAEAPAEKPEEPPKAERMPAPVKRVAPKKAEKKPAPEKAEMAEKPAAENEPEEVKPLRTLEKPEITWIPDDRLEAESPAAVAKGFLAEITKLMGVDVTVELGSDAEGNLYGRMTGDTLGILIGRRGETLDALQYLTSLKVNRGREGYTRVTLDTENYRAKREDTLVRLANRMANRATRTGRRVSLEPMNPYERRIIHFALQANDLVDTHSEGDEPNRHVVITLKK